MLKLLVQRPWLGALVAAPLLALLLGAIVATFVWAQLPELDALTDYQPHRPLRVLSEDGQLIGEFGAERRRFVPLKDIPKPLQDALLAVEDSDFYKHSGIDFGGILRAFGHNLLHPTRLQGASTITQQLARNIYLSNRQTLWRKAQEALLAIKIENNLGKEQILEIYMNQIALGNKAYGFGAAAERYFGKPLDRLDVGEIAMLVGLPKDPNKLNPVLYPERATRRQHVVLGRLQAVGLISAEQARAAHDRPLDVRRPRRLAGVADHAAEQVRAEMVTRYGEEAYTRGLTVTTTLRYAEQAAAQEALRHALFELERRQPWRGPEATLNLPDGGDELDDALDAAFEAHPDLGELKTAVLLEATKTAAGLVLADGQEITLKGAALRSLQNARRGAVLRVLESGKGNWALSQVPQAEGAVVTLDPASGAIRALVGGFDFARNQFNSATQAYRQPGSAFKPFVYSALIDQGAWAGTRVSDQPFEQGDWAPRNYDGQYEEALTLRQALAKSKNMVTIRLVQAIGPQRARAWAARFGFDEAKQPLNLTLALGTGSVTPLQMAQGYAAFANAGQLPTAWLVDHVQDAQGIVLWKADPPKPRAAVSARNAFMTSQLLAAVTREGTGARASAMLGRWDLYGKTGTTNDAVDAWFCGFQATRAGAVWIGYPQPKSLGERESGGGLALPVWAATMAVALRGQPSAPLAPPGEGLVQRDGDWFYEEFAGDLAIARIGLPAVDPAASAASASDKP
ncbi:penicillin-binding protein 1A [Pelomonas aquatica]|uniref:Penicillin-binding protein 1A n=1 Tax=Pelomonas aquatica TaxID=431058 RepID=A0A9X4LJT6_9BURK|nr:PBP1A family penicillin-binding protein [Pelomonas aquatica]MCY4754003.1 PBP1A family penicillin-binding protein [Pelomonas aquatica]MDG0864832.1 PBP1A family penicillin-binding protein [Pelomonas aquatica]